VRFYTKHKQTVLNSWYVKTMESAGWSKRAFPLPGNWDKEPNFLENLTSAAQFRLIDLFLAMIVY